MGDVFDQQQRYARLFACTDGSAVGKHVLELCKQMRTVIPVRTISMTGVFVDGWMSQLDTIATPMTGRCVNVVACDPAKWTWQQVVDMPNIDMFDQATRTAGVYPVPKIEVERAADRMSLYTAGMRNVLYAISPPRAMLELATARLFEALIVPDVRNQTWWRDHAKMEVAVWPINPSRDDLLTLLGIDDPT